MGMIKIILFLLLNFCFLSSYSQEKTDTVKFNNSLFIKHIVDAGESLKIISKKYIDYAKHDWFILNQISN